ncbi:AAA family ATPase [archaeon]|nr:AAA family ATPase [archaeon]MBT3730946.1 AAA family ATPase [archaeon]MBT4669815.1 AAA family ATPase [archaeon]MBT5029966.1 AAA family ATPase [archaeon]MBT5288248.1 AAA family ATPase [archaeon]
MKLKKIKLYNIRSYVNEEFEFPSGSTLLWGNIGSGKSSILLGIDFALFGLQRGNLTGASLLRNGAEQGFVELSFSIENKDYVIMRALKRSKTSVVQDFGYIIKDDIKEEKTAIELKSDILNLLSYPKELLTKNKALIFRYTVYTPQEEMKNILLGSQEDRLDTLRKVFAVDKYKKIKDNAKLISSKIKEKRKYYEGFVSDFSEKELEKEGLVQNIKNEDLKFKELIPKVELFKQEIEKKKLEVKIVEEKISEEKKKKKEIELKQLELKHLVVEKNKDGEKLEFLIKEIEELTLEKLELDENILEKIDQRNILLKDKERELRLVLNKIQELKTRKIHSEHIGNKVLKLNNCPTCFQEVSQEYKQKVIDKSNKEVEEYDKEQNLFESKQKNFDEDISKLKMELEELKKNERDLKIIKMKILERDKKNKEYTEIKVRLEGVKGKIGEINVHIMSLQEKIGEDIEEIYNKLKQDLENFEKSYREVDIEKHKIESILQHLNKRLEEISLEIEKKKGIKEKLEDLNKKLFWLSDHFIPLMDKMEKNILFKVHYEFNSYFEKWFKILIDNENLQMRLDESYSPKILQNGYDIDYIFLSGGEKTAGALAYRLALNQVVNSLNSGIKTRDLLILDEPTDGFSQEQLDRLKILMEEIKIPQVIIVSHEPQIESFVDNIIRLEKSGHETKIS